MTPALAESLAMAAEAAAGAADPWWIIGSAAVLLHGGAVGAVKDVDLLMSERDAAALLRRVGVAAAAGVPDARFRSAVFGTWRAPPLPVEVMGGFCLRDGDRWSPVALATRELVAIGAARLFVPAADELRRLLRRFGRAKDQERAALLEGVRRRTGEDRMEDLRTRPS